MTDALDAAATAVMLRAVAEHVLASTERLTRADQAVGDGDHGIGMARGFEAAKTKLAAERPGTVDGALRAVGIAIMGSAGGAAGAVFGTLFVAAAGACKGKKALNAALMAEAMQAALAAIQKRGGAKPGDKTMLDALAPAVEALQANKAASLAVALAAAADAARGGAEATRDMVAATGKARPLGARSIGHPDPGAITTSLIFEAMTNYTREIRANAARRADYQPSARSRRSPSADRARRAGHDEIDRARITSFAPRTTRVVSLASRKSWAAGISMRGRAALLMRPRRVGAAWCAPGRRPGADAYQ